MPNFQDHRYLESEQYKDASKLNARIQLHQCFSTNPYGWFRWVFDQFDLPSTADILEIGCGPGILWSENKARIPADWCINLSDFSLGMVCESRVNFGNDQKAFTFVVYNAMDIPFPDEHFDAVIANHMLYHVPDRKRALAEISRLLKPGGHFYAATNGANHLFELSEIINQNTQSASHLNSPTFSADEFTLENGMHQLTPWFNQIEIRWYEDSLLVTEAEPLVAYIHSMVPRSYNSAVDICKSNLQTSINRLIKQHGSIYIQKSTGIFIGVKNGVGDA